MPVVDYDNDYFEKRFAVDKSGESDKIRKINILKQIGKTKKINSTPLKTEAELIEESSPITMIEEKQNVSNKDNDVPSNLPFVE